MHARYGWYGDDFTGASDTLATLCRRGVKAFLYLGIPNKTKLDAVGQLEAIGIAGAARSMAPDAMREELYPIAAFLREYGVRIVHYKCCSTFDSAPDIGNLAVALDIFEKRFRDARTAIIGGQPSLGRYCAFGNLFARGGKSGEVFRIDRHPVMSSHPSTPMHEADIRLHLANQGYDNIALCDRVQIEAEEMPSFDTPVLFDGLAQSHIDFAGKCLRDAAQETPLVVLGASSVAEAWFFQRIVVPIKVTPLVEEGPVLAIAGSLSELTQRQKAAAKGYVHMDVTPEQIFSDDERGKLACKASRHLRWGESVFLSTAPADKGGLRSSEGLARATGELAARIIHEQPVRRLIVAGGDTSSHVVKALGFWGLGYAGAISDGVAIVKGRNENAARDGMLMMLKGGQMGSETLFQDFLETTEMTAASRTDA
ncbi:four-carbon acid sugar kinase family protein [Limoniibacter endophyticus]|uniref:Hrp-dependent type III effector protein n=1 Tax=Limoniibacter endophyticus TaxID=1565040 RepID=A0A8J3DK52_9HYPH|nr:four-carbon acid sugar kinase family protein [Limoniibacter endophyticus]GHC75602.1 Hrp-dependent type III effector protein [Limoniibacter endophyticus]